MILPESKRITPELGQGITRPRYYKSPLCFNPNLISTKKHIQARILTLRLLALTKQQTHTHLKDVQVKRYPVQALFIHHDGGDLMREF
jgi:hypothetical protein